MQRAYKFAIALLLLAFPAQAQTTWNPADIGTFLVLSNGNLTATGATNNQNQGVRSTTFYYTGKVYFEISVDSLSGGGGGWFGGVGDTLAPVTNAAVGDTIDGTSCAASKQFHYNGGLSGTCAVGTFSGGVMEYAIDIDNNLWWVRSSNDSAGVWNGSGANNPATAVGGHPLQVGGGYNEIYIMFSSAGSAGTWGGGTLNVGATAFTGTVPSGFTAWGAGGSSVPAGQVTWNPSDATSSILHFFDANLRAQGDAGSNNTALVRATSSYASGKVYFELPVFHYSPSAWNGGLANSTASLIANTSPGVNAIYCEASSGHILYNGSNIGNCSTGALSGGTILEIAVDLTARLVWFRDSNDGAGVWNGSGSNDPATGIGGIAISTTGCLYPVFYEGSSSGDVATAFVNGGGNLKLTGSVPAGFQAWQAGGSGSCLTAGAPNMQFQTPISYHGEKPKVFH